MQDSLLIYRADSRPKECGWLVTTILSPPASSRKVEATGIDLSRAIIPLPYKEPSQTLFQMLGFVTAAGQKFADSTEQVISDAASYGPVGTTMALLEASSKFFSAIHKRLHKSQKDEFRILAQIDYDYLPNKYPYQVPFEDRDIFKADFDGRVDIIPVSDPNIPIQCTSYDAG